MQRKENNSDLLFGMKEICCFLHRSEATVQKWMKQYDDFPVKKHGGLFSSRSKLTEWFNRWLEEAR